tara:strand:- start:49 stop:618 length:570 start_codon:yes stop_codon:yes gene_type:complete
MNMRTTNKKTKRNKKWGVIIGGAILILVAAGLAIAYSLTRNTPAAIEGLDASETQQEQVQEGEDADSGNLPDKQPSTQDPEAVDNDRDLPEDESLEAPTLSRASVNGSSLRAVATFQTTTEGTCRFDFSATDGSIVSFNAPISVGPSYYYCSIDIETSQLSGHSVWSLVVKNVSANGQRSSNSMEVSLP